mgnify:FL=1
MPQVRFLPSWYFNSQPHKEADSPNSTTYNYCTISTRSLTRRLTVSVKSPIPFESFQLTPSQGG